MEILLNENLKKEYEKIVKEFFSDYPDAKESLKKNEFPRKICTKESSSFETASGLSKIVLIPNSKELSFVLKAPISKHDFCADEVRIYREAKRVGLSRVLAPEIFFKEIEGIPFYLQLRADELSRRDSSSSSFSIEAAIIGSFGESAYYNIRERNINEVLVSELIEYEGEEFTEEFLDFCLDEEVNDLHSGNYGYYSGRPIIFDYSGYRGGSSFRESSEESSEESSTF